MHGFRNGVAITLSDTETLTAPFDLLYVGKTGGAASDVVDLAVQFTLGTTVIFRAVPIGSYLPIKPQRVMVTGTTANTAVVGLWQR